MIPNLDARGLLPSGIHTATPAELGRFNSTPQRIQLFGDFIQFLKIELLPWGHGMQLDVGGSFLSDKADPSDLDATLRVPLDKVGKYKAQLLAIGDELAKARLEKTYGTDFYVTIENLGNDFSAFFQCVGEKTAAAKYLHPKDRRGIARITL